MRRWSPRSSTAASTRSGRPRRTSPAVVCPCAPDMPGLSRGWLGDTAVLYARAFRRGAVLALANWPVGLVVLLYGALLGLVWMLVAPLGIVGGLILYLASIACISSWLSLVAEVLRSGRVRWSDLLPGFGTYLNDLLTVGFILWGFVFIANIVLAPFPLLLIIFRLAVVVFLNVLPELIYLGRHAPAELLVESYRFMGENWIEWFPANILLALCLVAARQLPAGPSGLVIESVTGLVLYFAMIVRGILFQELASSTRRGREFRRRAG